MRAENPAITFKTRPDLGLIVFEQNIGKDVDPAVTMVLVDPQKPTIEEAVVGYIWFGPTDEEDPELRILKVEQSAALHGYGPLIYSSALEWVRRYDGWLLPSGDIQPAATEIWRRFAERPDVVSETIPVEWHRHDEDWLNAVYRLRKRLAGYDRALRNGSAFVADEAERQGLLQEEVLTLIMEEGSSLFQRLRTDRRPNALKRRLLR